MKRDTQDNQNLDTLVARYNKHVNAVESGVLTPKYKVHSIYAARGLRQLIVAQAMAEGNDAVLNHVWGAAHWLTYNDGTLEALCQ